MQEGQGEVRSGRRSKRIGRVPKVRKSLGIPAILQPVFRWYSGPPAFLPPAMSSIKGVSSPTFRGGSTRRPILGLSTATILLLVRPIGCLVAQRRPSGCLVTLRHAAQWLPCGSSPTQWLPCGSTPCGPVATLWLIAMRPSGCLVAQRHTAQFGPSSAGRLKRLRWLPQPQHSGLTPAVRLKRRRRRPELELSGLTPAVRLKRRFRRLTQHTQPEHSDLS
jgi:hypothetical protein